MHVSSAAKPDFFQRGTGEEYLAHVGASHHLAPSELPQRSGRKSLLRAESGMEGPGHGKPVHDLQCDLRLLQD